MYTFVYNGLIKALFGVKVRDINFAFKLCRRRIFEHVELKSEGSFIDAELIIRSTRLGYEIMQMGVDYFPRTRGESTLSSPGVILTILREMWSLRNDLARDPEGALTTGLRGGDACCRSHVLVAEDRRGSCC